MFKRQDNSQPQDEQPTIAGIEALEKEINGFDLQNAPHSTTFQPNDVYLVEKAGYQILQVVFGNIVYSMGLRGVMRSVTRAFKRGEMTDFTTMINDARLIARNRMIQNAIALAATDVIGVTIEIREFADFLEVTATGTAVIRIKPLEEVPVAVSS